MLYSGTPKEIGRPRETWRRSVNKELGRVGKLGMEPKELRPRGWNGTHS